MGATRQTGLGRRSLAGVLLAGGLAPGAARAQGARLVGSEPAAGAVLPRSPGEIFVRFSVPVDHYRSRLVLMRDGQVVEQLQPRLRTAPEVLFAMAPGLAPGAYELLWEVVPLAGGATESGTIAFAIRP